MQTSVPAEEGQKKAGQKAIPFFFSDARAWVYVGAKRPHNCNLVFTGEVMLIFTGIVGSGGLSNVFLQDTTTRRLRESAYL